MTRIVIKGPNVDFFRALLERDRVPYSVAGSEGEGDRSFSADLSNRKLKELVREIPCEKQRERYGIPCYSLETLRNPGKLRRLRGVYGTTAFMPLASERGAIMEEFLS